MRKNLTIKVLLVMFAFFSLCLSGCENVTINELRSEHGIIVEGGSFEEGSILVSKEIDKESIDGKSILDTLSNEVYNSDGMIRIFDIYVSYNNEKVQPKEKVKVTIPVPDVDIENYVIFHIKDSGEVNELSPSRSRNNLIIEVDSFSYFVIAEKEYSHTHKYNSVVTDPTCTEEGYTTHTCKCGDSYVDSYTKELGHSFDEGKVTLEPTHFYEGVKTYTCLNCQATKEETLAKLSDHEFHGWYPSWEYDSKHMRECKCGVVEYEDCIYDEGVVTKEPSHVEEGIKTYTCTVCGRTKEEKIEKNDSHAYGEWTPSNEDEKHERSCACGEKETESCSFDEGKVTLEPSHFEEGIKTYTCIVCGRTKEEKLEKTKAHEFSGWGPSILEDKHERVCNCGEKEVESCSYDEGVVTKDATHTAEGIKTYTCTVCGRTKEDKIEKLPGHEFGKWTPSSEADKHERSCPCNQKEVESCSYDEGVKDEETKLITYTCTVCGRTKEEKIEEPEGIIIVINGGTASFEGKDTVTSDSALYGENANVYIAQANDVVNVSLKDVEGRTFKYWVSATGTIIPDEDFSILVFRSGYYYPVFEDTDSSDFTNRVKIFEGNCEEGNLYMSKNAKGDVKYELEFENGGHHAFNDVEQHNEQYHKLVCNICSEVIYEAHNENDYTLVKEATHTEEGLMKYECSCGFEWTENIPITDEHSVDYDDWDIVEESKNGKYGKYRVYCRYCDYYEEYWYLGDLDLLSIIDNKMIHYQATYGGKVTHDEYYYSYKNQEGKKVYIWALQYEYDYSSNKDYNDTYIFMYIDDENSSTLEPVYLSKSGGDRRAEYLWAIYGYVYDVNGWIKTLDSPDYCIGCEGGMLLSNSMSARSSVFESFTDMWKEEYNKLRIPTSKDSLDLTDTLWELYFEGQSFTTGYYDENDEYVETGGRDVISLVKNKGTSYQKYMHVDKETGMTYGYEDWGTSYRSIYIMRKYMPIVSPEEYEALDDAGKSKVYSYGDIEKDIKSLCSKRTAFNNFTLTVPKNITSFRFLFSDRSGNVTLSGSNTNVYYNSAYVYNSGSPITLTWEDEEGIAFDRYEIWDFQTQAWVILSESPTYTFNTSDNPVRDASYVRVVYHEVDVPVNPGETYRVSINGGYFEIEIDGTRYTEDTLVEAGTLIYMYADEIEGKVLDHWVDGDGNEYYSSVEVISDIVLTPVYVDATYNVYVSGWNYDSYVSVDGSEPSYTNDFVGKINDSFELSTEALEGGECNVFIGWYMETYAHGNFEYILISDKQTFTYVIEEEVYGGLYAVWTTGDNPFVKTYVDIKSENGFVRFAGGEGDIGGVIDNAYSSISLCYSGMINIYDDPTDEINYSLWDVQYRYELEGEIIHDTIESYEDEYDFYPANFWVSDPMYNYPDGVINVTGITEETGDGGAVVLPPLE